jgi:hypothetical protein
MPNAAELIQEVYIDPIKSVLFIDDKFPTYADAINGIDTEDAVPDAQALKREDDAQYEDLFASNQERSADSGEEPILPDVARALNLTRSCRECGYIFDVENSAETALGYEKEASFINKADFVVLDFILDDKTDSGRAALEIIELLDNTKRFNLVVVYTNNDPSEVAHEIAHFLRGKKEQAKISKNAARRLGEIPEERLSEFLTDYLSGELAPLAAWYGKQGLKGSPTEDDLENAFETYASARFPDSPVRDDSILRGCGTASDQSPWICGKGVFIAVVHKNKVEATVKTLLKILKDCLVTYVPSPISMLIHKSINTLKEGGTNILEHAFGDEQNRAALLYRALTVECRASNSERVAELRFGDLMRKALSVLSFEVQKRTADFGSRLLSHCTDSCSEENQFNLATKLEKLRCEDERQFFLNVNATLCCQPLETGHMTTGMIFRQKDKKNRIWICATPACDLVPGRDKKGGGYRDLLSPANYFEALRIQRDGKLDRVLSVATQANHLFINVDGSIQAFQILQGNSRQPQSYIFYTQDGGYLNANSTLTLKTICTEEQDGSLSLVFHEYEFEVIGQLRPEYASRFLTITGDWNSRIGVDFVNFSKEKEQ